MAEAKHPFGGRGGARRPKLRADLKFVYDNPGTGDGSVRIVDPLSGRQCTCDRREHILCTAADGETDLDALHARLEAEGGGLSEAEVARFFRRLHVLGFLQSDPPRDVSAPPAPQTAPASSGVRDLMARRRQEMEAQKTQTDAPPRDPAATRDLLARRRREMETKSAAETRSGRPSDAGAGSATAPEAAPGSATAPASRRRSSLMARRRMERTSDTGAASLSPGSGGPPRRTSGTGRDLIARRRREREEGQSAPAAPAPESDAPDSAPLESRRDLLRRPGAVSDNAPPPPAAPPAAETAQTDAAPAGGEARDTPEAAPAVPSDEGVPVPPETESVSRDGTETPVRPAPEPEAALPAPDAESGTTDSAAGAPASSIPDMPGETEEAVPASAPQSDTGADSAPAAAPQEPPLVVPAVTGAERTRPAPFADPGPDKTPAAAEPTPPARPENSAAKAAMASAQSAVRRTLPPGPAQSDARSSPDETAPARPAPAKPAPGSGKTASRKSELMARRLRERANRGHAPETGKPAPPVDPAPGSAPERAAEPAPEADGLDFDVPRDDFEAPGGGMAGGMRGGGMGAMGGMRGGMMGAGGMGAMGGMRGGMMGAGGMGAMGGMRGGMMGGGMPQQPARPRKKMPGQLPLFDPHALLRVLYIVFYPAKYILWAIVPLVVLATMTMGQNIPALMADYEVIVTDFSFVAQFLLAMFLTALVARLAQGVAIVAHGGRVPVLGLALVMGILPRFVIDRSDIPNLDRRGQLWAYGATLLARLTLFSLGMLVWAITRDGGGILPYAALIVAQLSLVLFVITAWPLFPSDGQRWCAVMMNEPRLMPKMLIALRYTLKGGELPPMLPRHQVLPLVLFGLGTLLTVVLFLGVLFVTGLTVLVGGYDGLGLVLFLIAAAAVTFWLSSLFTQTRQNRGAGAGGFDRAAFKELVRGRGRDFHPEPTDEEERAQTMMPSRAKVVWGLVLCGLLAIAFLPYSYETGGEVEILPIARGQATARTDGEIVEVMVREGDVVTRGQVLAQLSSWNQEADIRTTRTQLAAARAALAKLENGATDEEIEVARKQLESAQASVAFKQAEVMRNRELAERGVVSQAALEKTESDLEIDLADLEVARANYNEVVAPATREELEIARADVETLEEQLAFQQDELERTRIVAPLDGRVITPDLNLRLGSFLRTGDVLLEIEQTETVSATILVTEADIGLISVGDTVRLKTSGQSAQEILGEVQAIAPSANEEDGFGRAIRVTAEFDNSDGFLRSGMTGYAKIEGEEMRVWEAYLRSIRHFFQIEVWSWIP